MGESMVLKLVVASRLVILARTRSALAVKLARDGIRDVRKLLLLLVEVLSGGGGG